MFRAKAPPRRRVVWMLVPLLAACGGDQQTYSIDILGPPDVFDRAEVVELTFNGTSIAQALPQAGSPFTLESTTIDPEVDSTGILAIRGLNGPELVALGAAPQLEVLNAPVRLRIFVQKPGTLARAADLAQTLPGQIFVTGRSVPTGELSLPMNAPIFGLGQVGATELSNQMFVYNPVTHQVQDLRALGTRRSGAAAATAPDGRVFLFGGLAADSQTAPGVVTGQMDAFSLGRQNLSTFFVAVPSTRGGDADSPRTDTVLVATQRPLFAVGGRDPNGQPLASVVSLDLDGRPADPIQTFVAPGAAPRVGHTATLVDSDAPWDHILIYGGAPAGQAVAEVLDPAARVLVPLDLAATPGVPEPAAAPGTDGHPGPGRRGHAALLLPTTPPAVLILGGMGDDGMVRTDSILYDPAARRFRPGGFSLATPRANFVAFVIGKDVVVAGGIGADGQPVDTAEIFDVDDGTRMSEQPAVARVGASATPMPNLTMAILGGLEAGDVPSKALELYLPRQ